jgi:hypothetical protein
MNLSPGPRRGFFPAPASTDKPRQREARIGKLNSVSMIFICDH